jgi:spore coat protein H
MIKNDEIETLQLYIHPNNLRELKSDIWCEDPVPAQLKISGKKLEVDVNYRGSHIRNYKKKSYEISYFKPNMFRGSKIIHLNAEYRDPSILRNKLSFDFFAEIGNLAPYSRHVFLKLNGKSEGIYLEIESVDEHFIYRRKLPQGSIFYAVDGDANFSLMSDLDKEVKKSLTLGYERKYGSDKEDSFLQELIYKINTIPRAEFEKEIPKYLNVDQYLRWMAGVILTQNYDGFVHNYSLYRNSLTGQFEIIPWDYDATWGRDVNGKIMEENYVPIEGYNTLTARLMDVDHFRNKYKELICEIMENQFTTEFMQPKIEKMHQLLRPYVLLDPYKKGDIDLFDEEPKNICSYIEKRRSYLQSKIYKLD